MSTRNDAIKHGPQAGPQVNLLTRLQDLTLALRQQICHQTITPVQPVETKLGYIADPLAMLEFRKQRNKFRKEMGYLQELGKHITLGAHVEGVGLLGFIEREWRKTWATNMAEIINQDKEEWRKCLQKGETPPICHAFRRNYSIHDVYAHVESYVEENWENFRWADSYSSPNSEKQCRRRALDDIMLGLRFGRVFSVLEGLGGIWNAMQVPEAAQEFNSRLKRKANIEDEEEKDRAMNEASGFGWTPGPQKAICWEEAI